MTDFIFFNFDNDSTPQHVGIVIKAHHRTGWRHRYWKNKAILLEGNSK